MLEDQGSTLVGATVGAAGTLVGVVVTLVSQHYLDKRRRSHEVEDRQRSERLAKRDLVWHYVAPLRRAAEGLSFRLKEITEEGPAVYLLDNAPPTSYYLYKRTSTLYRLAVLLGWIRGYRKERSYLDLSVDLRRDDVEQSIGELEQALADGQHIELRRLDELTKLWRIPGAALSDPSTRARIAAELDSLPDTYLSASNRNVVAELTKEDQKRLCVDCANLIRQRSRAEIDPALVESNIALAIAVLGIKEAYLYRDWQAAIGDMMLVEVRDAARRFDVVGYGEFEARYHDAKASTANKERIWFERLESLISGLDFSVKGHLDARREQLRKTKDAVCRLEHILKPLLSNR